MTVIIAAHHQGDKTDYCQAQDLISVSLVKKLKAAPPDYAGACREILRWTRAGGRELPGLKKRREAEYRQCVGEAP